jgi:hypothetical protein
VEQTIKDAAMGNLQAILALAFSPIVHQTLSVMNIDPEVILSTFGGQGNCPLVVVHPDPGQIINLFETPGPGPIFDLHPDPEHQGVGLAKSAWYVPLFEPRSHYAMRGMCFVLAHAKRVYVIGRRGEWERLRENIMEYAKAREYECVRGDLFS